eukprot:356082-Chlamydomonas_euryale.AAC.2
MGAGLGRRYGCAAPDARRCRSGRLGPASRSSRCSRGCGRRRPWHCRPCGSKALTVSARAGSTGGGLVGSAARSQACTAHHVCACGVECSPLYETKPHALRVSYQEGGRVAKGRESEDSQREVKREVKRDVRGKSEGRAASRGGRERDRLRGGICVTDYEERERDRLPGA